MATLTSVGGGSGDTFKATLLASLTSIPTSNTAISGTENWQKYDAIYFDCLMHYSAVSNVSVFTNLILTNTVSIGVNYEPIRVIGSGGGNNEVNIDCYFSENEINLHKEFSTYDITKLNIYGVNF